MSWWEDGPVTGEAGEAFTKALSYWLDEAQANVTYKNVTPTAIERRANEAEATIRELVRLFAIAEMSPRAIPIGHIFDDATLRYQLAQALEHARRIARESRR